MGSDVAYEDLRPENVAVHTYTLVGSEALEGRDCFVVDAVPATPRQAADSGYGRRRLWVRKGIHFTVNHGYHDKKGRLEKIGLAGKLASVRGTMWRPGEGEMRDVQAGPRPVVHPAARRLAQGLAVGIFTEAELVRGRP